MVPANASVSFDAVRLDASSRRPQNIIVLISDGCGPASFTMARDYARKTGLRDELYLDQILVGAIRTNSANREITDSAAAATAFACGVKANHQAVGVDVNGAPAKSVLEVAEDLGMATGVVATKAITDATPAAFTAHVAHRYDDEPEIAVQQISGGFDLLFGGGLNSFLPEGSGGRRKDGRDLLGEAAELGYNVIRDRSSWDSVTELPVLALLADRHLSFEIDRDESKQPSFPEIVSKAIDLLDDDPDGFFLVAEGSLIDIAGHANDAAAHLHDILAYDDAVKVALDFARANENTLVVSVSDHETGGLTIGRSYRWDPEVLGRIRSSHNIVRTQLQSSSDRTEEILAQSFGIDDLSKDELDRVHAASSTNAMNGALSTIVGDRAGIDWTSFGHTAVDVNVYAFGPGSANFAGHNDNTLIGQVLHQLLVN
ncbi:MAG: alkaline phosphatase [Rhodothermales bacterium]|nr:alkaline phosphatase [Rhodothermales bacterium]